MPKPTHFEIHVNDLEKARAFYGELFGWTFESYDENYVFTKGPSGEPGINGALMKSQDGNPRTVNTCTVSSMAESIALVERLGGKLVVPKQSVPGMGSFCYCTDPDGNIFGLWENEPSAK